MYVVVVRVVSVVGTFESVSTAAAAGVAYAVVVVVVVVVVEVVAVSAPCRPPALNLQPRCFATDFFIAIRSSHRDMGTVRVCAAAAAAAPAAAAAVVLYCLHSFRLRDRCLPSLLLLLFTWYTVGGDVVAVPAPCRPLSTKSKTNNVLISKMPFVCLRATAPTAICCCAAAAAAAAATAVVVYSLRSSPQQCLPPLLLVLLLLPLLALLLFPRLLLLLNFFHTCQFHL